MSSIHRTVYTYIDSCCFSFSVKEFGKILSKNITLEHQTNNDVPFQARGKHEVSALFKKYVFDNTSNVNVKKISLISREGKVLLNLAVEVNKHESGKINRYILEETSVFRFEEQSKKITSIKTKINRIPAPVARL